MFMAIIKLMTFSSWKFNIAHLMCGNARRRRIILLNCIFGLIEFLSSCFSNMKFWKLIRQGKCANEWRLQSVCRGCAPIQKVIMCGRRDRYRNASTTKNYQNENEISKTLAIIGPTHNGFYLSNFTVLRLFHQMIYDNSCAQSDIFFGFSTSSFFLFSFS